MFDWMDYSSEYHFPEEDSMPIKCSCGYDTDNQQDFDQHVLASMHDNQDHFQVRG